MSNPIIQLVILAAIVIFLVLRLRDVLGTRDGFEPTELPPNEARRRFEVIPGKAEPSADDEDIADHAEPGSPTALALAGMKKAEPGFMAGEFLSGAKGAYEMILMAFERGDLDEVRPFLSPQVGDAFQSVIDQRNAAGHTVEAQYLGTRETSLSSAQFDPQTGMAELTVRFVGELIAATKDAEGNVIEGDPRSASKQRDIWTFARRMGQSDPNWQLVATGA